MPERRSQLGGVESVLVPSPKVRLPRLPPPRPHAKAWAAAHAVLPPGPECCHVAQFLRHLWWAGRCPSGLGHGSPVPFGLCPPSSSEEPSASPASPLSAKRRVLSRSALRSHQPVARPVSMGLSRWVLGGQWSWRGSQPPRHRDRSGPSPRFLNEEML